jgi:ribosomal protein S18 acetylase RimI-like enzyme
MAAQVVSVTPELRGGAALAAARGFQDNEIWVWMVPSDRLRRRLLLRYYRGMIRVVFAPRGGAWTTTDTSGAALWYPPGTKRLTGREQLAELWAMMPWALGGMRRGIRIEQLMASHRPREPHWYLNTLSVDPAAQRRGIGSALIAPGLERADSEGLGSYLETQRRANIPFYRRFGFEEIDEISLPDSPPMWLMWRPARSRP